MKSVNSNSLVATESSKLKSTDKVSPTVAVQRSRAVFNSMGLIRPTAELIFVKLMTESPEALLNLLNRILKPGRPFVELDFFNTAAAPDTNSEPATLLRLLLKADDGKIVNVEIQNGAAAKLERHAVFCMSRLVSMCVQMGSRYEPLPECIVLYIIEGEYFTESAPAHQAFEFLKTPTKNDTERGQRLHPSAPKLHFIELGKLVSNGGSEDPTFKEWAHFLLPQSMGEWEQVAKEFPMFSGLKKKVEHYSANDKLALQQHAIDESSEAHAHEMHGAAPVKRT